MRCGIKDGENDLKKKRQVRSIQSKMKSKKVGGKKGESFIKEFKTKPTRKGKKMEKKKFGGWEEKFEDNGERVAFFEREN